MGCLRVGEFVCVGWCCVFVYMIALFGILLVHGFLIWACGGLVVV